MNHPVQCHVTLISEEEISSNSIFFFFFGSCFPSLENIVMVTYTLSLTTSFSMCYTGNFCLMFSPVLLGMAWAAIPCRSKPGAARKCSVLGGIFHHDVLQEDQVSLTVYFDIPAAATTDVFMEDGCGFALCRKHNVVEQNPTPLNQAALVSHIWVVCTRSQGEGLQRKVWKQVIVMIMLGWVCQGLLIRVHLFSATRQYNSKFPQ